MAPPHSAHPHTASCARLLQTADIPPETARLVKCHNPWPSEDVLFCPDGALPAFVTSLHWETCLFYLDDIIVFSSTWEDHLARLREVFERLRHAKLKLGPAKCTFAAKEVSYLGHRVTEEGLLPDPTLLAAIRDIPPPKTATEVRSFLGSRRLLPPVRQGFCRHCRPLACSDQEGCALSTGARTARLCLTN